MLCCSMGNQCYLVLTYFLEKMMNTLKLQEGDIVKITSTTLPLGKFVKIQPQSTEFLNITDPKAVLEKSFRNFSTLTPGTSFFLI